MRINTKFACLIGSFYMGNKGEMLPSIFETPIDYLDLVSPARSS